VHDTAFRKLNCAPDGLGVAWIAQVVPFQCSAKVPAFEPPTAVHDDAEVQATPLSPAPPCEGLGVAWIAQVVPFQCSAKVPEFENPTAVHDTAEVQATPKRTPPPDGGLAAGCISQVVPFHRSAKVPAFEAPTAVQAEAEEQETPNKIPPPEEGLGVAWMDHLVPFHRSARVMTVPERVNALPTATQAEADVQSTAFSVLLAAPAGLGVGSTLQRVPFHRSAKVTVLPNRLV